MFYKIQKVEDYLVLTIREYKTLLPYSYYLIPVMIYSDNDAEFVLKYVFRRDFQNEQFTNISSLIINAVPNPYQASQSEKYMKFLIDNKIIIKHPVKNNTSDILVLNPSILLTLL